MFQINVFLYISAFILWMMNFLWTQGCKENDVRWALHCLPDDSTNLQCRSTKRGRKSTSSVVGLVSGLQPRSVSPNRHGTVSALTVCPTNGINTLLQWGKMHRENSSSTLFAVIKKDGCNEKHFKCNQVLLHASIAYVDVQQWLNKLQKAKPVSQSRTAGSPNI